MPSKLHTYAEVMAEHARRLERVAERQGVGTMRRVYEAAQNELGEKLRRLAGRGLADSFGAHQARVLSAQVYAGQISIAGDLSSTLGQASHDAQVESLRGLATDIARLDRKFRGAETVVPIEEASRFWKTVGHSRDTLLEMHQGSMLRYGTMLANDMQEQIGLGLATGESTYQVIDRIQDVAQNEWWQAERIVRTETAYAFNRTHSDGLREVAREIPEIMQRWTEHVTDSGDPMDSRVGIDSIVLHGQVARAGGLFTMPPDDRVSASMWGKQWDCPPNRPNDRAVLAPWRKDWGIPGWQWIGGRREDVST